MPQCDHVHLSIMKDAGLAGDVRVARTLGMRMGVCGV